MKCAQHYYKTSLGYRSCSLPLGLFDENMIKYGIRSWLSVTRRRELTSSGRKTRSLFSWDDGRVVSVVPKPSLAPRITFEDIDRWARAKCAALFLFEFVRSLLGPNSIRILHVIRDLTTRSILFVWIIVFIALPCPLLFFSIRSFPSCTIWCTLLILII